MSLIDDAKKTQLVSWTSAHIASSGGGESEEGVGERVDEGVGVRVGEGVGERVGEGGEGVGERVGKGVGRVGEGVGEGIFEYNIVIISFNGGADSSSHGLPTIFSSS